MAITASAVKKIARAAGARLCAGRAVSQLPDHARSKMSGLSVGRSAPGSGDRGGSWELASMAVARGVSGMAAFHTFQKLEGAILDC
jgi:hypothetical protein